MKRWTFSAQARKISFTLASRNPEKSSYIFAKKAVLIFWETENLKKLFKFQGTELSYVS